MDDRTLDEVLKDDKLREHFVRLLTHLEVALNTLPSVIAAVLKERR